MAPSATPLWVFICILSLSTPRFAVAAKLETAHGSGSSMLQDALHDMEEKDMDILGAETMPEPMGEDAEAMRQRLLAIDAERALLHRRLGLAKEKASEETEQDGLRQIFDELARELAPLVGLQMLQEMVVLLFAGILVYYVTKRADWRTPHTKQPKQPEGSNCMHLWMHGFAPASMRGSAGSQRVSSPSLKVGMASPPSAYDCLPPKVMASTPWRIAGEPKLPAESKSLPLKPPPGLELEGTDDTKGVSSLGLNGGGDKCGNIQAMSNCTVDPGPPPGLDSQLADNSVGLAVQPLDPTEDVIKDALEALEIRAEPLVVSCQAQEQSPEVAIVPEPPVSSTIQDEAFPVLPQEQGKRPEAVNMPDETLSLAYEEQSDSKALHPVTQEQASTCDSEGPPATSAQDHLQACLVKRKKSTKVISEAKSKAGVNSKEEKQSAKPDRGAWRLPFWHCVTRFFAQSPSSKDDEFCCAMDDVNISKKKAAASLQNCEKVGKRKAKQHQRPAAQKCVEEASQKKSRRSWGLQWPCSLPLTAAIFAMLFIVLAGRLAPGESFAAEKSKELLAKEQKLEQLKRRHAGYSFRLAVLKLDQFQEDAAAVLASLPAGHAAKLQDAKEDARQLRESLRDIADEEFPQVEESIQNVYSHWVKTLAAAREMPQCEK